MTHPYFRSKAQEAFKKAGGDPLKTDALAHWAETEHTKTHPDAGVIVAEDGTIITTTRVVTNWPEGPTVFYARTTDPGYLDREVGLALGSIQRDIGQRVIHLKLSELTTGKAKRI